MLKIYKFQNSYQTQNLNALCIRPEEHCDKKQLAIFCHGYTSHKGSLLNWGTRLAEIGITTILFDLPGHYLASFTEVDSFESFKIKSPKIFESCLEYALNNYRINITKKNPLILGGHSLGALFSVKALNLDAFKHISTINILVGLGALPEKKTHLFETPFYKDTLNVRKELVSRAIAPDIIFPWIRNEKDHINIQNKTLHFITGENDLVVGSDGTQRIIKLLDTSNIITFDYIKNLPHHLPERAASYIKKHLICK